MSKNSDCIVAGRTPQLLNSSSLLALAFGTNIIQQPPCKSCFSCGRYGYLMPRRTTVAVDNRNYLCWINIILLCVLPFNWRSQNKRQGNWCYPTSKHELPRVKEDLTYITLVATLCCPWPSMWINDDHLRIPCIPLNDTTKPIQTLKSQHSSFSPWNRNALAKRNRYCYSGCKICWSHLRTTGNANIGLLARVCKYLLKFSNGISPKNIYRIKVCLR